MIVYLAASSSNFSSKASRWSIYKILSVDFFDADFQSIFYKRADLVVSSRWRLAGRGPDPKARQR